jgi:hypothetical protein
VIRFFIGYIGAAWHSRFLRNRLDRRSNHPELNALHNSVTVKGIKIGPNTFHFSYFIESRSGLFTELKLIHLLQYCYFSFSGWSLLTCCDGIVSRNGIIEGPLILGPMNFHQSRIILCIQERKTKRMILVAVLGLLHPELDFWALLLFNLRGHCKNSCAGSMIVL